MTSLLSAFEACEVDAAQFGHREHVQAAFEMLQRYDYLEAAARYARSIRTIATKAGAPEKFHVTITLAFLSVIAERMAERSCTDFETFIAENEDLMRRDFLRAWYSDERLNTQRARELFVLPRA